MRVGLEDSIYLGKGRLAESNAEQVAKIVRILRELSLEIATPDEARRSLLPQGAGEHEIRDRRGTEDARMTSRPRTVSVIGVRDHGSRHRQRVCHQRPPVSIVDRDPLIADRAKSSIERDLEVAIEEGFVARSDLETIVKRITPTADLEEAVEKAGLVVEASTRGARAQARDLEAARGGRGRGCHPRHQHVVLRHQRAREGRPAPPERVIGTHWYNPAHIVPCVEVVPADATSDQTIASTVELLRRLGKEPAVTKSVPGFVGNRIQLVMAAEAFRCVEQGIATPEAVDAIVRSSFGFRLGAFGPLQVSDLAGLDVYESVYDYLTDRCGDPWYEAPRLLRELVQQGRTGVKSSAGVYEYSREEAAELVSQRDRVLYRHLRMYLDDRGSSVARKGASRPEDSDGL